MSRNETGLSSRPVLHCIFCDKWSIICPKCEYEIPIRISPHAIEVEREVERRWMRIKAWLKEAKQNSKS